MRYTIGQLSKERNAPEYMNDLVLLKSIVSERKAQCTNYYSPLYERLVKLENNLQKSIMDGQTEIACKK